MSSSEILLLKKALEREKKAREEAEQILEDKSLKLYNTSLKLKDSNNKLESLLEENLSQIKVFFKNFNDAFVIMDLKGNITYMNSIAYNLSGYATSTKPINVIDIIHKQDYKLARKTFQKFLKKGYLTNFVTRIITKDKIVKWIQINASVVFDNDNNPIKAQGIVRDITKDIEYKNQIKESESRLFNIINNLEKAILLETEKRKIALTNKKFCNLFKIPLAPKELKGLDCSNSANEVKHLFKNPDKFVSRIEFILNKRDKVIEEEIEMVDGTILERDFIPIIVEGEYKGHLWSYKDVTLHKKYNASLKNEREKYRRILANMNLGFLEVDLEDTILLVNKSFSKMSGYSQEELLGKKGKEIFLNEKGKIIINKQSKDRSKGSSSSYELDVLNKHGETRNWLVSGAPNYDLKGNLIGSIGIHLDITNIKKLEKQKIIMLNKLGQSNQELEEYAHIVSHDLKSPLRSISAITSWIKEDNLKEFNQETLQNFELLDLTLEKMEGLISGILNYSKINNKLVANNLDLNILIKDLLKSIIIPENISIKILNVLPTIIGDKFKFQQLFQNLIENAIKAIDKEFGYVEIGYKNQNSFHQFFIKDNGIGIEDKYFKNIFKLFQSLNKDKSSSGIGLSIVKKIVHLYEGQIWLESEIKKGSIFYFTIKK